MVQIDETATRLNSELSSETFPPTIFYLVYRLQKNTVTFQRWCQVILTNSYHREARIMNVLVTKARQRES